MYTVLVWVTTMKALVKSLLSAQTVETLIQQIQTNVPFGKKEKEVTRVKFTNNISYPEARKIVENIPAQTYSAIVQSSNKEMKDAQTQTSVHRLSLL